MEERAEKIDLGQLCEWNQRATQQSSSSRKGTCVGQVRRLEVVVTPRCKAISACQLGAALGQLQIQAAFHSVYRKFMRIGR